MKRILPILLIATVLLAVTGCAGMPPELAAGGPYLAISPAQAGGGDYNGKRVRWGGAIVQALPQGQQTCFEVTGLALSRLGEPLDSDTSTGRFMACAAGFYDPAIYAAGRFVTFTGQLDGLADQVIGNRVFAFPRLQADTVYLWPRRDEVIYVPYPVYDHPYYDYYPYPPYPRRR